MHEDEKTILIETEQRAKANTHRIDKLETSLKELNKENRAIYKIASSVEVMAQKIGTIDEKVDVYLSDPRNGFHSGSICHKQQPPFIGVGENHCAACWLNMK